MKKAAFLDRDGTIIFDVVYLNDPKKIQVFEESYEAIRLLNAHDYLVILATNQSGVARGFVQLENLHHINELIIADFKKHHAHIHGVYYCPHPVDGGCKCRKPNGGMLEQGAKDFDVDLAQSWMVGDRITDVGAGISAGCMGSILLQNEHVPRLDPAIKPPKYVTQNVLTAAQIITGTNK